MGEPKGDGGDVAPQEYGQGRLAGLAEGGDLQAFQDLGRAFDQGVIVAQPGGVQVADAAQVEGDPVGFVDFGDDVADGGVELPDHVVGIAEDLEADQGVVGDPAVVETAGDFADHDLGPRFLGQPHLQDGVDDLVDDQDRIRPVAVLQLLCDRDAAADLGQLAAVNMDTAVVALFDDLDAGTVGTAGGTITWANFLQAISMLRTAKAPPPYRCVLHPGQWYHLANSIGAAQTVTNAPALQDAVARSFFVANAYGVDIFIDANITDAGTTYGAMFSPMAMALDVRRAPRIEVQRDASRGGGGYELNLTSVYAVGEWRSAVGVCMTGTSVEA